MGAAFRGKRKLLFAAAVAAAVFLAPAAGLRAAPAAGVQTEAGQALSAADFPEYAGSPYTEINGGEPYFSRLPAAAESFESYSGLDELGRCGQAFACVGTDLMPTEERGQIDMIRPTGWHTVRYDFVDRGYLYNRCHLIAYQLAGENANEKNLITGTRWMNTEGMQPFENQVAAYVRGTGNHVLYRVTPYFDGDNLLASGVLMEALSVEDGGAGVSFCVYVYNVQPGVIIDYATGESSLDPDADIGALYADPADAASGTDAVFYVLNTSSMKFHLQDCESVEKISARNRQDFSGTRDEVIGMGYVPCKICAP